jgi:hypothetical protein
MGRNQVWIQASVQGTQAQGLQNTKEQAHPVYERNRKINAKPEQAEEEEEMQV